MDDLLCSVFLCLGAEDRDTEGWVVSSESCSFQSIGARYVSYIFISFIFVSVGQRAA